MLEKTYHHVPFDVPANAVRLEIEFHYNDQISSNPTLTGGNTIDLGVFDERGIKFLAAGFRGWSGSERDRFVISEREATPGYLTGPLNPGRWHVLLGLYKLAPQGCHYQITVTVETQPGYTPYSKRASEISGLPFSTPPMLAVPWLRGELHCHTWHSDGALSAASLVERARQRGLDFLAVADHNTIASQRELAALTGPGLVLIQGVEVTTFKGHFNAWGIPDWIDFRVHSPEEMQAALQRANTLVALTSCGHPKPFGPNWDYPEVTDYACVEVWNGPWNGLNAVSLAYWLDLLAAGHRMTAVGGSDYHRTGEAAGGKARDLGTPTNWVYLPGKISETTILQAIRAGRVSLSDEPDGPLAVLSSGDALQGDLLIRPESGKALFQVSCQHAQGCQLWLLNENGTLHSCNVPTDEERFDIELPVHESRYVRAELRTEDGWMRGLTNPIYLYERSSG